MPPHKAPEKHNATAPSPHMPQRKAPVHTPHCRASGPTTDVSFLLCNKNRLPVMISTPRAYLYNNKSASSRQSGGGKTSFYSPKGEAARESRGMARALVCRPRPDSLRNGTGGWFRVRRCSAGGDGKTTY